MATSVSRSRLVREAWIAKAAQGIGGFTEAKGLSGRMMQGLAISLSALAGFVDAQGYISLGGFFVAFMSGNSTVLGISWAAGAGGRVALAAGLVGCFVGGVMVGVWVGRPFGARRPPAVLGLVAGLLLGALALHGAGWPEGAGLAVAMAMGAENTVFAKHGQSGIGLTYMTGTLVRLGQRAAEVLHGGRWEAVIPDVLLWGGMVVGAGLGAAAYGWVGLSGLWFAVGAVLVMAWVARAGIEG